MKHIEVVRLYEVGPIAVSDDRWPDCTYKVEVLRDVGRAEKYRLFLWSRHRYFVRRCPRNSDAGAVHLKHDNAYKVEVLRDVDGAEEYHSFNWDKDKFEAQLRENPDDWQQKLIEAKDNSVLWEDVEGSTVEDVLNQLTEILLRDFTSVAGDMRTLRYKELVKIVDLEPISIEENDTYHHFRIEIFRNEEHQKSYKAKVYRYESYSLQPTFAPDGELAFDLASCWLWIEDERELLGKINGHTVEEVVEQAIKARDDLETRLRARSAT